MPKRRGVSVSVIDIDNHALIEYGQQSDRRFTTGRSRVSTFIEAKDSKRFLIKIRIDNPFAFQETTDPIAKLAAAVSKSRPAPASKVRSEHNTRAKLFDDKRPAEELSSPVDYPNATSKVPFDLMVSVYIDGRTKPECRQMVYLDPNHPRYSPCTILRGRWVDPGDESESKAGLLEWMFSDRGIEHILGKLDVKKAADDNFSDADSPDINAISEEIGEGTFEDSEKKPMKAGQIEVRFRRVVILPAGPVEEKFKAYHYAGHDEQPRKMDDDCTHTTSFMPKTAPGAPAKMETFSLRHVPWEYYKKGENFWAQFIFNYTARYKLIRMNLSEADGRPTLKGRMQRAEAAPAEKRGTKRAAGVECNAVEEDGDRARAKDSSFKGRKAISGLNSDSESSISEEDIDNTAASTGDGRYEMRDTRGRGGNYKKARLEDECDKIS